jgi:hypothetical protein
LEKQDNLISDFEEEPIMQIQSFNHGPADDDNDLVEKRFVLENLRSNHNNNNNNNNNNNGQ